MKKALLALAFTALAGSATAADVGIYGGRLFANGTQDLNTVGVSVGDKFGKFGVQATADRSTTTATNLNRYTASASYDVAKFGKLQTNVRAGVAYLDPQSSKASNGGAGFVGAGVAYPVTKKVSAVADYAYQKGNNITKAYNGSIVTAGFKYSF